MRERFFHWLASRSADHPWRFLLAAFVVFVASAAAATQLVPKLTIMDLLPEDEPKVREYVEILENYGNTEIVLVSIEGPDPDELIGFARKFEERVLALTTAVGEPFFQRVVYREDIEFMTDHGLMLAEADDLDQMLDNGLLDEPGLASVVGGYNRMFKAEYVDGSGDDESLESQEAGAVRMIDSMWALPKALRWHLEHPEASAEQRRAEIEEAVHRFTVGDEHFFSDDKSLLLMMVHPTYSTDEFALSLPGVQYLRDVLEELLLDHPAIAENYAGPWETTGMWEAFTASAQDDQARLDSLRLQVPYKAPAIAPLDKLDSGTGITGMQVIMDDETMTGFHDMGWNMVLAFIVVLVLFIVTFRMWTSPAIAMVVLVMSITMALGINALALGELTMMAMMFPIILLGLGVDYFVHILGEFTQRRGQGDEIAAALEHTLKKTGRGVLTGGLTTAIAFLALAFTSFRGFTDFGVSAGIGVLCTLITSFLVLPAALVVIHRFRDRRAVKKGRKTEPKQVIQFRFLASIGAASYTWWPVTLVLVAAITVFLGYHAAHVGVATNMLDVEAENLASIALNDVLEERFYLHPDSLVVSANSLEESWALTDGLDDLSTINMVDSISYVLPPPSEQEERAERVEELAGRIEQWGEAPAFTVQQEETEQTGETSARRVDAFLKALYQMDCNIITIKKSAYMAGQDRLYDRADAIVKEGETCVARVAGQPRPEGGWPRVAASQDMKAIAAFAEAHPEQMPALLDEFQALFQPEMRATYTRMANPEPVTLESLPASIRDRYQSKDGSQFLVTAYPNGDVWETGFQERIFGEVETVSGRVTGMPPLFVATMSRGAEEGRKATLYALIAITLLLLADFWWLSGGRPGSGVASSLLALVPLAIGTIWTVGCMTLLDIDINMANVIAIPLILGIGIDNGVHVIHRYRLEGEGEIRAVLSTVGRSIMLTSLTTIAAFGTFAFGLYRGLSSMGVILGVGIAICFLLAAFLLPALFRMVEKVGVKL